MDLRFIGWEFVNIVFVDWGFIGLGLMDIICIMWKVGINEFGDFKFMGFGAVKSVNNPLFRLWAYEYFNLEEIFMCNGEQIRVQLLKLRMEHVVWFLPTE